MNDVVALNNYALLLVECGYSQQFTSDLSDWHDFAGWARLEYEYTASSECIPEHEVAYDNLARSRLV